MSTITETVWANVQVKIPEDLAQQLRVAAAVSGDTQRDIVQIALEEYFERNPVELPERKGPSRA